MGYVICHGTCVRCGRVFSFNPNKVPSIRLDGERRPFCRACVAHLNTIRVAKDLPPIVPLPGAYEVADEDEIIWD